ncbi:MAG: hypothetical protein V1906_01450 [Candidatus Woesearchaeota archaeon]
MKGDKAMEEYRERYERGKAKISELNAEAEAEARRDRIQRMTRKYEARASPRDENPANDDSYYHIERIKYNFDYPIFDLKLRDNFYSIINKDPIIQNISYKYYTK